MTEIVNTGALFHDNIDSEHYLASLLKLAIDRDIITDTEFKRIKSSLNSEIARVIVRLSKGKSSSIRSEVASTIAESVAYTVSMALKKEETPYLALRRLTDDNILNIFLDGTKAINAKLKYVKHVGALISSVNIKINNDAFNGVLNNFQSFIKSYNPDYTAHLSVIGEEDYPTAVKIENLVGVEFAAKYFEAFYYESKFLSAIGQNTIDSLLREKPFYSSSIFNIFDFIFSLLLLRIISDMPLNGAPLSASDKEDLIAELENNPSLLIGAKDELMQVIKIKEDGVQKYTDFCFENIIYPRLTNNDAASFVRSVFS